eukprot:7936360-Pyramimonas_sp.AAC.1
MELEEDLRVQRKVAEATALVERTEAVVAEYVRCTYMHFQSVWQRPANHAFAEFTASVDRLSQADPSAPLGEVVLERYKEELAEVEGTRLAVEALEESLPFGAVWLNSTPLHTQLVDELEGRRARVVGHLQDRVRANLEELHAFITGTAEGIGEEVERSGNRGPLHRVMRALHEAHKRTRAMTPLFRAAANAAALLQRVTEQSGGQAEEAAAVQLVAQVAALPKQWERTLRQCKARAGQLT